LRRSKKGGSRCQCGHSSSEEGTAGVRPKATSTAATRYVRNTSIRDVALTASNAQEAVIPNLIFAESG
jgi:hypothetical protein